MAALLGLMLLIYYQSLGHKNVEQSLISAQLEAIEEKRFTEAYYSYTSKDFQAATTLEGFKKFLSSFSLLTLPHTVKFEQSEAPGKVHAILKAGRDELKLLFTLQKQDTGWKVQKIEVVNENDKKENTPDFDSSLFLEPVKKHMEAIKEKNLEKAYHDYTAAAFQEATSFKDFDAFVKEFPVFSENANVDYKKLTFNNNIGTYEILMTDKNGSIYDLKYDIIAEYGVWKILQIQIVDSSKEE